MFLVTTVTSTELDGQAVAPDADAGEQASTEHLLATALDEATIARLAELARSQGIDLLGDGGLLQQLTKRVLEAALDQEMDAHLGRERYARGGGSGGNARNGSRSKTLITEVGSVPVQVPRDRHGTLPGSPGESHPQAPTDPDVNLSVYPARAVQVSGRVPQRPMREQVR